MDAYSLSNEQHVALAVAFGIGKRSRGQQQSADGNDEFFAQGHRFSPSKGFRKEDVAQAPLPFSTGQAKAGHSISFAGCVNDLEYTHPRAVLQAETPGAGKISGWTEICKSEVDETPHL